MLAVALLSSSFTQLILLSSCTEVVPSLRFELTCPHFRSSSVKGRYTRIVWQYRVHRCDRTFSDTDRASRRRVAKIFPRRERHTNTPMEVIFRGNCAVAG